MNKVNKNLLFFIFMQKEKASNHRLIYIFDAIFQNIT